MNNEEQIIIDGKGCRYKTWDAECSLTGDHYGDNMKPCKFIDEKSCYFKQLVRKAQEFKQLQEKYEALKLENKEGYEIVDELKHKCEELKSQIDADYEDYSQELKTLRNIIKNKEKRNARLFVIFNNYLKALDEIKSICNKTCEVCQIFGKCDKEYSTCKNARIIDIINKAKGKE